MLACYPAALIFRQLPKSIPSLKHIFSIVLSIGFITFCLGPYAWIHSFVSSLVTYFLLAVLPHGVAHKVAFSWALGYMFISHLYRQYTDYMGWTLDFTTMQMVLTIKLTSFAFNYYDGNCPVEKLSEEQKKRSIKTLPPLLEYFGFVYFFCSFMAGPAIEITEYQNFINYSMFADKNCQGRIPSAWGPAFWAFLNAIAYLPLMILSGKFPIVYLLSDAFRAAPFWEQAARLYLHPTLCRMKYYFGWNLAEGACILSGIGYNGVDKNGKSRWDRCRNVFVTRVECAPNIRSVTTFWNLKTGDWLKNYVYLRITPEGAKPTFFSTFATYAVSAFWHGFYPGYYSFFLLAAVYTEAAKDLRRVLRPFFVTADDKPKYPIKHFYDAATIATTSWFLNYAGASFLLLSFERAWTLYGSLMFFGHVIPIAVLLVTRTVLKPPRRTGTRVELKQNTKTE